MIRDVPSPSPGNYGAAAESTMFQAVSVPIRPLASMLSSVMRLAVRNGKATHGIGGNCSLFSQLFWALDFFMETISSRCQYHNRISESRRHNLQTASGGYVGVQRSPAGVLGMGFLKHSAWQGTGRLSL